ncbi:TetR/AcrR family transcriptional regulator [Streptomyces sp. NPDC003032]
MSGERAKSAERTKTEPRSRRATATTPAAAAPAATATTPAAAPTPAAPGTTAAAPATTTPVTGTPTSGAGTGTGPPPDTDPALGADTGTTPETTDPAPVPVPAPVGRQPRADARRNRERIVAAAREAFSEAGPDASLNDIARRAGVGPGTLYRHFPARHALLTAVLKDRIDTLCDRADELADATSPDEALTEWLRAFLAHARGSHGLGGALMAEEPHPQPHTPDAPDSFDCHQRIQDTAHRLLTRAQRTGTARRDLTAPDLVQLIVGIALSTAHTTADPGRPERLLALVLDAVSARPKP